MSEIRSGGHLHVESPIHLAGCPYFHNKIRPELYYIFFNSRPTSKEIKKKPITYTTSKSWRQKFPEETDYFWTFSFVGPDLGHFTELWNSFGWKCSLYLICSTTLLKAESNNLLSALSPQTLEKRFQEANFLDTQPWSSSSDQSSKRNTSQILCSFRRSCLGWVSPAHVYRIGLIWPTIVPGTFCYLFNQWIEIQHFLGMIHMSVE